MSKKFTQLHYVGASDELTFDNANWSNNIISSKYVS
jgi:hypothetical protein